MRGRVKDNDARRFEESRMAWDEVDRCLSASGLVGRLLAMAKTHRQWDDGWRESTIRNGVGGGDITGDLSRNLTHSSPPFV